MDCNFPEQLARDLESSAAVLTSRCMTAVPPSFSISSGDPDRLYSLPGKLDYRRTALQSRLRTRASLSGADWGIDSRIIRSATGPSYLTTFDLDAFSSRRGLETEDSDFMGDVQGFSDDASESSFDNEPPSIRCREQSVTTVATATTAATSVNSGRCSSLFSHRRSSPMEANFRRGSWIDLEPDMPFTPTAKLSKKRPTTSSGMPSKEARFLIQPSVASLSVPKRRSSLSHRVSVGTAGSRHSRQSSTVANSEIFKELNQFEMEPSLRPHSSGLDTNLTYDERKEAPSPCIPRKPVPSRAYDSIKSRHSVSPSLTYDEDDEDDEDRLTISEELAQNLLPAPDIKKTSRPSNIHNWLESSVDSVHNSHPDLRGPLTPLTATVPIPGKVIDCIALSINSFPDTMLTTGSLSIETIRAYSRKMKRPSTMMDDEAHSLLSGSGSEPETSWMKRWRLPKLLVKSSTPGLTCATTTQHNAFPSSMVPNAASSTKSRRSDGTRLKGIFPFGSRYLLDGLYAHIVAFNYITSLRQPPSQPSRATAKPSSHSSLDIDSIDDSIPPPAADSCRIPKKAAGLLGLSSATDNGAQLAAAMQGEKTGTTAVKAGFAVDRPANQEAIIRNIQEGLAGCIAKLVATLKLTTGHNTDTPLSAEAARDVDPMFMRALCEVVRAWEEVGCL